MPPGSTRGRRSCRGNQPFLPWQRSVAANPRRCSQVLQVLSALMRYALLSPGAVRPSRERDGPSVCSGQADSYVNLAAALILHSCASAALCKEPFGGGGFLGDLPLLCFSLGAEHALSFWAQLGGEGEGGVRLL